jgi:hypothetical protein
MLELLRNADEGVILGLAGMLVGVVGIIGGISVAITKVVSSHYRRTQLNEMEATLKMEMIQRGMSAAEIKQVLEARMDSAKPASMADWLGAMPPFGAPRGFGKACGKT